jgi:hypothetical protein
MDSELTRLDSRQSKLNTSRSWTADRRGFTDRRIG